MPDIWPTFDIRQITGYLKLEISRISGIRIVSISGIGLDIEMTGYPAQPYFLQQHVGFEQINNE